MTQVSEWTKILGGSILSGIGFFSFHIAIFSGNSIDAPVSALIGAPLLMIGPAFYIKGMKAYLKGE